MQIERLASEGSKTRLRPIRTIHGPLEEAVKGTDRGIEDEAAPPPSHAPIIHLPPTWCRIAVVRAPQKFWRAEQGRAATAAICRPLGRPGHERALRCHLVSSRRCAS